MEINVNCRKDKTGEDFPVSFEIGGKTIHVKEVLDVWPDPTHVYFKVRTGNESLFILRHDLVSGKWHLSFFKDLEDGDGG